MAKRILACLALALIAVLLYPVGTIVCSRLGLVTPPEPDSSFIGTAPAPSGLLSSPEVLGPDRNAAEIAAAVIEAGPDGVGSWRYASREQGRVTGPTSIVVSATRMCTPAQCKDVESTRVIVVINMTDLDQAGGVANYFRADGAPSRRVEFSVHRAKERWEISSLNALRQDGNQAL